MDRQIIVTGDGSTSFHVHELNEQYHSVHGALRESRHVFLNAGFNTLDLETIAILEMGLGTGLNALLTVLEALSQKKKVVYTAFEKYPLTPEEIAMLNFHELLNEDLAKETLSAIHRGPWGQKFNVNKGFCLTKVSDDIRNCRYRGEFNLIYFDAFGPLVQPDLWASPVLKAMYTALAPGGILVTYSAKGEIRRRLQRIGFTVERLQGPPGKRHMVRATKS